VRKGGRRLRGEGGGTCWWRRLSVAREVMVATSLEAEPSAEGGGAEDESGRLSSSFTSDIVCVREA
jgi:hypothetical protein